MSDEAAKIRARASLDVSRALPYFHKAVTALVPRPCPGLGTWAVTDRAVLLFDPVTTVAWHKKYGRAAMAGLLLHEALHWVCAHHKRRGDRDPKRWNIAGDLWINSVIDSARASNRSTVKICVPSCGVMVSDYVDASGKPFPTGLTADEYYKLLEGAELSKSGQAKADAAEAEGGTPGAGLPCAGECGSGAGNANPAEAGLLAEAQAQGEDAFKASAMSGRSTSDQLLTAKAVALAARAAAQAGTLPGGLDRWVDSLLELERIPWPVTMGRTLRPWIERAGRGARTYATPSHLSSCLRRRGSSTQILLPARVAQRVRWWLIIDTSGSMDAENVRRGVSYAKQLADKPGAECYVGSCDTKITPPVLTRTVDDMMGAIKGGGGTTFVPVFELYEQTPAHERPDYIVIYTDGHGPAPARKPEGANVLWLLSDTEGRPARPAAWGTYIELDQP